MKIMRTSFLLCLVILLALPGLAAADADPAPLRIDQVDVTAFPEVTLRLSAWDQSGRPLEGLTAEDFTLQEDDGATFHPLTVEADTDAPLQVALVLDISGSMQGQPLADAQAAATRFLDRLSQGDHAALIAFAGQVDPDPANLDPARERGLSGDLKPVYDLVEELQAGGATHLYNAVAKGVRLFEGQPAGHRAVLLLSDGVNDPDNIGDPNEAITLAQQAGVPVFVIGLGNGIDEPYLQNLAAATGGLYRAAPRSSELADLFGDMAALLKTQYRLAYDSALQPDGGMHTLQVTINTDAGPATSEIAFGPLPQAPAPTRTPTKTPTSEPTIAPTQPPTTEPTVPPTATPLAAVKEATSTPGKQPAVPWWGWLLAAALALGLTMVFLRRRQPRATPEACASCGFDMTGKGGACPNCGSTKRLPKV